MSILFSPYSIKKLEVKNRFVHSATQECMSGDNGEVTDELIKRYVNLAKGEIGLIIPGDMYVEPLGRSRLHQTGIHSDEMIPGLRKLVDAVHQQEAKVVLQLAHAGRQTSKEAIGGRSFSLELAKHLTAARFQDFGARSNVDASLVM